MNVFGEELRRLRLERDLSQSELGRRSGLSYAHISRLESGDRNPSQGCAASLAEALGLDGEGRFGLYAAAGFLDAETGPFWRNGQLLLALETAALLARQRGYDADAAANALRFAFEALPAPERGA